MSNAVAAEAPSRVEPDFESIEQAVRESKRGRWFLEEYARRLRRSETTELLQAIGRLEGVVAASQDALTERLSKALGVIVPAVLPADAPLATAEATPLAAAAQTRYFKQDEEIFEPAAAKPAPLTTSAAPAAPAKAEVARGARLTIRRKGAPAEDVPDPASAESAAVAAPPPQLAPEPDAPAPRPVDLAAQTTILDSPKRRIVIIRHKAGDRIDVPLQPDAAETA